MSYSKILEEKEGATRRLTLGLSAGYNSRQGLTSISLDQRITTQGPAKNRGGKDKVTRASRGATSTYNFVNNGYVPSFELPFEGSGFIGMIKVGSGSNTIFGNGKIGGFYNRQILRDKYRWVDNKAYGYLNLNHDEGKNNILDFNREKDGIVSKNSSHLPVPIATHDLFTLSGQGIVGQFRPYRTDVGVLIR